MIEIKDLHKSYERVQALANINLSIRDGELIGIIGANGAGKSTLLKCLTGLVMPDQGSILINGLDAMQQRQEIKSLIGYAPEAAELYPYLTGREYLDFIADMHQMPRQVKSDRILHYLSLFDMAEKADLLIDDYSHGMRQKISLSAAMISQPSILVVDEPTNGLDPESVIHFKQELQTFIARGCTILFSSHILDTVEKICHRVAVLHQGRLLTCATMAELRQRAQGHGSLEELFMALVKAS